MWESQAWVGIIIIVTSTDQPWHTRAGQEGAGKFYEVATQHCLSNTQIKKAEVIRPFLILLDVYEQSTGTNGNVPSRLIEKHVPDRNSCVPTKSPVPFPDTLPFS